MVFAKWCPFLLWLLSLGCTIHNADIPDSKVHGANMGPTWVLSAPDGPHVSPMNLAIWDVVHWNGTNRFQWKLNQNTDTRYKYLFATQIAKTFKLTLIEHWLWLEISSYTISYACFCGKATEDIVRSHFYLIPSMKYTMENLICWIASIFAHIQWQHK